jgi:hypothetical protein
MIIQEKNDIDLREDPIVAEVRKARESLYAEAGYDLYELSRRLRKKQELSGRQIVSRSPRSAADTEEEIPA